MGKAVNSLTGTSPLNKQAEGEGGTDANPQNSSSTVVSSSSSVFRSSSSASSSLLRTGNIAYDQGKVLFKRCSLSSLRCRRDHGVL